MMVSKKNSIIIIDTSAIISILQEDDSNHAQALEILNNLTTKLSQIIIPADVYTETVNTIGKKWGRKVAVETTDFMNKTSGFILVNCLEKYPEALDKYQTYSKFPSFTDCIVMATADKYQTKEIFGFDECFSKNGYTLPT